MTTHARFSDDDNHAADRGARLQAIAARRTLELAQQVAAADARSIDSVDGLLVELCRRNPDALAHARRVAAMSCALSIELHLPDTERGVIERAALLHDIGKLAMPLEVMYRTGRITSDDLALIRTHPQLGFEILRRAPALRLAADVVRAIHEAWDGGGHPERLSGASIPVGARVIAVADTYDVLTSGMVGEPCSPVIAMAEIVRGAGTYFDPDVVHAALALVDGGWPACATQPVPVDVPGSSASKIVWGKAEPGARLEREPKTLRRKPHTGIVVQLKPDTTVTH